MSAHLFRQNSFLKIAVGIIPGILILDQVTKWLARFFLKPVYSISVIGDFFRLTYVENPGIAFGLRISNKIIFTILSIVAVIIIFYYLFSLHNHKFLRVAFACILGGALGNLTDRFIFGRVVDFLDFEFFDINISPFNLLFFNFSGYQMDRWPVFNVADIAVTMGMIMIIVNAFLDSRSTKTVSSDGNQKADISRIS